MAGLSLSQLQALGYQPTQGGLQNLANGNLSQNTLNGSGAAAPQTPSFPSIQNNVQTGAQTSTSVPQSAPQQPQQGGGLTLQQLLGMGYQPGQGITLQGNPVANTPANQSQTQVPTTGLNGQPITNATDATMLQQKLAQWQAANTKAASDGWLGQLLNGAGRTAQTIGLGIRQDIAKAGNWLDIAQNLNPNSPNYNPLLDTNSATAQAYQQLVAKGQTGWEKAGKTIADIGSFLAPSGIGDVLGASAAASEAPGYLGKLADVAHIVGGNSEALAPYTTSILGKLGLTALDNPELADSAAHLTPKGVFANQALANIAAGTFMSGIRSGKTTPGSIVGGALAAAAGGQILGAGLKLLQTPTENLEDLIRTNPETAGSTIPALGNAVTSTLGGKGESVAKTAQVLWNKYDTGSESKLNSLFAQMGTHDPSVQGDSLAIPQAKGEFWDTGKAQLNNQNVRTQTGDIYDAVSKNAPGVYGLDDEPMGGSQGLISRMKPILESMPAYDKYVGKGGLKSLEPEGDFYTQAQKIIDNTNAVNNLPEGSPTTAGGMHNLVKILSEGVYDAKGNLVDDTHVGDMNANAARIAYSEMLSDNLRAHLTPEAATAAQKGLTALNTKYGNTYDIEAMLNKMEGKKIPGAMSQSAKHLFSYATGGAGLLAGIPLGVGGVAGLGSGGYIAGQQISENLLPKLIEMRQNSALGALLAKDMPELTDEIAKGKGLLSQKAQQQANELVSSLPENLKKLR